MGRARAAACAETGCCDGLGCRRALLASADMTDLIQCHRSVLESSVAIVGQATALDLERPTPCIAWTLRQLLAHMIGQNQVWRVRRDGSQRFLAAGSGTRDITLRPEQSLDQSPVHTRVIDDEDGDRRAHVRRTFGTTARLAGGCGSCRRRSMT